jgi:hypothetical protein
MKKGLEIPVGAFHMNIIEGQNGFETQKQSRH